MKYYEHWQGEDGIRNVIPNRKSANGRKLAYPEGTHVLHTLWDIIGPTLTAEQRMLATITPIIEIGCGYGRLCTAFHANDYLGLDINEQAILLARESYPTYRFQHIDEYNYPPSHTKLLYTVLMHIPDSEYQDCIKELCKSTKNQIVIVEILGRKRRRKLEQKKDGTIQPTFGREESDHIKSMKQFGWYLFRKYEWPYPTKAANITALDFRAS